MSFGHLNNKVQAIALPVTEVFHCPVLQDLKIRKIQSEDLILC